MKPNALVLGAILLAIACEASGPKPLEGVQTELAAAAAETPEQTTLTFTVDVALAREVGLANGGTDKQVVAAIADQVRRRMLAWDIGPELAVTADQDEITVALNSDTAQAEAEPITAALQSIGIFELFFLADVEAFARLGTELVSEQEKLIAWHDEHPETGLLEFNRVGAKGGPHLRLAWFPTRPATEDQARFTEMERATPVILPASPSDCFGAAHVDRAYQTIDALNYPAVMFELRQQDQPAFAAFTGRNVGRLLAIVMAGEIVSAPRIESSLPGAGIIQGRFTSEEVDNILRLLQSDPARRVLLLRP